MNELIEKLLEAVEFGKIDQKSPYPPQLRGICLLYTSDAADE